MIHSSENTIIDNESYYFENIENAMHVSIAYDKYEEDVGEPLHLYVELFEDFEKENWYSRDDLEDELRELNRRFDMGMNVEEIMRDVDDCISDNSVDAEKMRWEARCRQLDQDMERHFWTCLTEGDKK